MDKIVLVLRNNYLVIFVYIYFQDAYNVIWSLLLALPLNIQTGSYKKREEVDMLPPSLLPHFIYNTKWLDVCPSVCLSEA